MESAWLYRSKRMMMSSSPSMPVQPSSSVQRMQIVLSYLAMKTSLLRSTTQRRRRMPRVKVNQVLEREGAEQPEIKREVPIINDLSKAQENLRTLKNEALDF